MDFENAGKDLAKVETSAGTKAVALIKDCLISISSDDQMDEFLDSYLNYRINQGEEEKEAKNYKSRVKAILKNWKESEKRTALYDYTTKSVQLLAKYARDLNKKDKPEDEEAPDESVKTENLLSLGDISAELDRLAQHLQHHGRFDLSERLMVIANEVVEEQVEPATI
jgi:murein L,D-transpeptidase YcbB/YkuD